LNRWCSRAGIPERSPYALRHYYGTTLAASGTNLAVIAQLMGHSNVTTTMRYIANNDLPINVLVMLWSNMLLVCWNVNPLLRLPPYPLEKSA